MLFDLKRVSLFLSVTFLLFANVGASTNCFKVISFLEIKYIIFIGNSLIKCHKTRLYKYQMINFGLS